MLNKVSFGYSTSYQQHVSPITQPSFGQRKLKTVSIPDIQKYKHLDELYDLSDKVTFAELIKAAYKIGRINIPENLGEPEKGYHWVSSPIIDGHNYSKDFDKNIDLIKKEGLVDPKNLKTYQGKTEHSFDVDMKLTTTNRSNHEPVRVAIFQVKKK